MPSLRGQPIEQSDIQETVVRQLAWLGEDPFRDGLRETPRRVAETLVELTSGYHDDPDAILSVQFSEACDQLIVVKDIEFWSLCEHHMLPFHGHASVGYIPREHRIVGLSKLARVVHCFAKRLQNQERMTTQIAEAIERVLHPAGVGVVLEASHTCMQMRGIRTVGSMVTSDLRGALREEASARQEFLSLVYHGLTGH
jgi:GTP cyclohydrolase I